MSQCFIFFHIVHTHSNTCMYKFLGRCHSSFRKLLLILIFIFIYFLFFLYYSVWAEFNVRCYYSAKIAIFLSNKSVLRCFAHFLSLLFIARYSLSLFYPSNIHTKMPVLISMSKKKKNLITMTSKLPRICFISVLVLSWYA